jgi:hypothetical protein
VVWDLRRCGIRGWRGRVLETEPLSLWCCGESGFARTNGGATFSFGGVKAVAESLRSSASYFRLNIANLGPPSPPPL